MIIAGIQRTSLLDWPGKICSTIFIAGCNFRCPFCHNPELVLPSQIELLEPLTENEILALIVERKQLIDGVCITGGEPLLSPDITNFVHKIKATGLPVKIDTNGSAPTLLRKIVDDNLVDYIAMDIKAPRERYNELAGFNINLRFIEESIKILKDSNINYEFRTTVVKTLLGKDDIIKIGEWVKGAKAYYLQQCNGGEKVLDPTFKWIKSYTPEELENMLRAVRSNFEKTGLRGV